MKLPVFSLALKIPTRYTAYTNLLHGKYMHPYLTEKQRRVMEIIRDFFLEQGYAPSLGELQQLLGISTKRGVVNHLNSLEKKGFIIRTSEARGIKLVEEEEYEYLVGIPILGYANAGTPLAMAEEDRLGVLHVEKKLLKNINESSR